MNEASETVKAQVLHLSLNLNTQLSSVIFYKQTVVLPKVIVLKHQATILKTIQRVVEVKFSNTTVFVEPTGPNNPPHSMLKDLLFAQSTYIYVTTYTKPPNKVTFSKPREPLLRFGWLRRNVRRHGVQFEDGVGARFPHNMSLGTVDSTGRSVILLPLGK